MKAVESSRVWEAAYLHDLELAKADGALAIDLAYTFSISLRIRNCTYDLWSIYYGQIPTQLDSVNVP